ncbi:MAG: hypothetical protein QM753_18060 [Thermomicrobiales bacterium]
MRDTRIAQDGYLYGTQPNPFLAEHAHLIRGPGLCLAEGAGHTGLASVVRFIARKRP